MNTIRAKARELVEKTILTSGQPISSLYAYIPMLYWQEVEEQLKRNSLFFSDPLDNLFLTNE
ncbi:MAG: DUF4327 family protein [Prochloraceae cyanobacterium]